MKLIIDANVLFSALIKDSLTIKLVLLGDLTLYAPDFFILEFLKYEKMILKKTKRSRENYVELLHSLNDVIQIIPEEEFKGYLNEAEKISPDEKDVSYMALALKMDIPLWSNDKKLKEQNRVKVFDTKDIIELV